MTHRSAWGLLALLVLVLLLGTQMPGAWRGSLEHSLHAPFPLSSLAHFVVFAGMGGLLVARPLAWPVGRVVLAALGLALLTEGLQFWAVDRHPRWVDVGIDMGGVVTGMGMTNVFAFRLARR